MGVTQNHLGEVPKNVVVACWKCRRTRRLSSADAGRFFVCECGARNEEVSARIRKLRGGWVQTKIEGGTEDHMEQKGSIGDRIKEAMKAKSITVGDLAQSAGMSVGGILRLRSVEKIFRRTPKIDRVFKILGIELPLAAGGARSCCINLKRSRPCEKRPRPSERRSDRNMKRRRRPATGRFPFAFPKPW